MGPARHSISNSPGQFDVAWPIRRTLLAPTFENSVDGFDELFAGGRIFRCAQRRATIWEIKSAGKSTSCVISRSTPSLEGGFTGATRSFRSSQEDNLSPPLRNQMVLSFFLLFSPAKRAHRR